MYLRYCTQWRAGPSGPIGLDYTVFFHELDRMGLERDAYDEFMAALRVIEETALDALNRKD